MKNFVFLLLFGILITTNYAQSPEWINYSDGSKVNCVAEEGDFMWVGTSGSLIRINKNSGEKTYYDRSNSGISSNDIRSIAIDKNGNKWIVTYGGGLVKFDGANWTWYNSSNSKLPIDYLSSIAVDSSGNKWIGTLWDGLIKYDGTNWTIYNGSNSGLGSNMVKAIITDKLGVMWIVTDGNLVTFDGTVWNRIMNLGYVRSITIDKNEKKWIGTSSGIVKIEDGIRTSFNTSNSGLPTNDINYVISDNSENIWAGTPSNGLVNYNGVVWKTYNTSNSGLLSNELNTIGLDNDNYLWLCTAKGMVRFNGANWTAYNTTNNSGLTTNYIRSIAIDSLGNKWIASNLGVTKYDGTNWALFNSLNSPLSDNSQCIEIDNIGNKWIGIGQGIAKLNDSNPLNMVWNVYNNINSGLQMDHVKSFAIGSNGDIWLGINGGLARYNNFSWTAYYPTTFQMPRSSLNYIKIDQSNNKWIGTEGGGLVKYDGSNWVLYNTANSGLLDNYVYSFDIDQNGDLWICTKKGLSKFDGTIWTNYTSTNSALPNGRVKTIKIDNSGNKWLGVTDYSNSVEAGCGLIKYDGINWSVYTISNSGLPSNRISCIAIDEKGNKWIGTENGGLAVFREGGVIFDRNISLNFPKGGEVWCSGKSQIISWSSSRVSNIKIEYSIDNGKNWVLIGNANAITGGFNWIVPQISSTKCRLKISDADDPNLFSISKHDFTIISSESSLIVKIKLYDSVSEANLGFGALPTATDGIDQSLNEITLPPIPPSGILDARFELPGGLEFSKNDFRPEAENIIWNIKFQPSSCGYPITLSWDTTSLPSGALYLKDRIDGSIINVDMKKQSSLTLINQAITTLQIEYNKQITVNTSLNSGWNMVSVPVVPQSLKGTDLFSSANSQIFGFNGGYTNESNLALGKGYWVRYSSLKTEAIKGTPNKSNMVNVLPGWNIIGVYDKNVAVKDLTTSPVNNLSSQFYGFTSAYVIPDTLKSGKGYWIKVNASGTLNLNTVLGKTSSNRQIAEVNKEWNRITISDRNGNSKVLYLADESFDKEMFELPPIPPTGIFDARFDDQTFVSEKGKVNQLELNSNSYPLRITVEGTSIKIKDSFGGQAVNQLLKNGESLTITNEAVNHLEIVAEEIPVSFELYQNYPNPFNPTTKIKFTLPQNGRTKLTIYNSLGERVTELLNKEMETGYHEVEWNASNLSSGVYLVRISFGSNQIVKKIVLMK